MGSREHVDSINSLWEPLAPQQTQRLTQSTAKAFIRALDRYVDNGGVVSLDLDEQSRIVTFVIDRPESLRLLLIACMDEERYGSSRVQGWVGGRE